MTFDVHTALVAALGASAQEVVYWYNRRAELDDQDYRRMLRSPAYWMVTAAMVLVAGAVAALWFEPQDPPSGRTALVLGAALPLLLKQAVNAATHTQPATRLGGSSTGSVLRSYFGY